MAKVSGGTTVNKLKSNNQSMKVPLNIESRIVFALVVFILTELSPSNKTLLRYSSHTLKFLSLFSLWIGVFYN